MVVRPARQEDLGAVMTVFDSAQLAVAAERVRRAMAVDQVLVAELDGHVLGALLVAVDGHSNRTAIEAVAVRPGRRDQGIGSRLVRAAAAEYGPLIATFDKRVRSFWDALEFEIVPTDQDRCRGRSSDPLSTS